LPAYAGPPFVTDDPVPTEAGHWEVYGFVAGTHVQHETDAQGGLDINYGVSKNLQLTVVIPVDLGNPGPAGLGDIELAVKYRFLHHNDSSLMPDVAFFPGLVTPTTSHPLTTDRTAVLLPIWAQKDIGKWSLFGGGGYDINPGADNRNFWLTGVGFTREVTDHLTLGGELYRQTADTRGAKGFMGINAGAIYKLGDHWSLLASAGPGVENLRQGGQYDFYFALGAVY
jgi:hypothetical protein